MTDETNHSRRRFLAGVGAGGIASLAGCLTTLPAFGQRVRYGEVDEPSHDPPVYRDWLAEEDESVASVDPGAWGPDTVSMPGIVNTITEQMDAVGIPFDSFDYALSIDSVPVGMTVARADIDRTAVEETLDQIGYEHERTDEGYDIYSRQYRDRVLGVGDEFIIQSRDLDGQGEAIENVEARIDTKAGRKTRQHEGNSEFARVTDAVGGYPWAGVSVGKGDGIGGIEIDGSEALYQGDGYTVDDDGAYLVRTLLFPAGETVTESDVRDYVSQFQAATAMDRVDIRIDGRLVTIVAKATHSRFEEWAGGYVRPLTAWSVEYGGGSVTFRYEAGESLDPSLLTTKYVDVSGDVTEETPYEDLVEPTPVQFVDVYDTVEPGDALRIDVSELGEWRVFVDFESPDSDETWTEVSYNDSLVE